MAGGQTLGTSFTRATVSSTVSAGGLRVLIPFSASATYGRVNADAPLFERFSLGGGPSPVLDRSLLSQAPRHAGVCPAETSVGTQALTYRVSATLPPLVWYFWGGSTTGPDDGFHAWHPRDWRRVERIG